MFKNTLFVRQMNICQRYIIRNVIYILDYQHFR